MKHGARSRGRNAAEPEFNITELSPRHRTWAADLIRDHWGSETIVTRSRCHDTRSLPGFLAGRRASSPTGSPGTNVK